MSPVHVPLDLVRSVFAQQAVAVHGIRLLSSAEPDASAGVRTWAGSTSRSGSRHADVDLLAVSPLDAMEALLAPRSDGKLEPLPTALAVWSEAPAEGDGALQQRLAKLRHALFDRGLVVIGDATLDGRLLTGYLASSLVTTPSQIGGTTKGRVSMTSLGRNGRYANQLFQYAFTRLYALRHGLTAELPEWPGRQIYGLDDARPGPPPLPEMRFFAFDDDDRALWSLPHPPVDVDFWGYFQELPACFAPHRALLRRLFTLSGPIDRDVAARVRGITEDGLRPLVAMHIRRGDYVQLARQGLPWYRPVPLSWYQDWLTGIWPRLERPVLYIATDGGPEIVEAFEKFAPVSLARLAPSAVEDTVPDFEILRRADHLAIANSSYSRMAALLAADEQKTVIPDFERRAFVSYAPWSETAFWARFADDTRIHQMLGDGEEAVRLRGLELRRQLAEASRQRLTEQSSHERTLHELKAELAEQGKGLQPLASQITAVGVAQSQTGSELTRLAGRLQQLETHIGETSARVSDLVPKIPKVVELQEALEPRLTALANADTSVLEQLQRTTQELSMLSDKLRSLLELHGRSDSQIARLVDNLGVINASVERLDRKAESLTADLGQIGVSVRNLEPRVATAVADLSYTQSMAREQSARIAALGAQTGEHAADVAALAEKLRSQASGVDHLTTQVKEQSAGVAALSAQMGGQATHVAALATTLGQQMTGATALAKQLSVLETQQSSVATTIESQTRAVGYLSPSVAGHEEAIRRHDALLQLAEQRLAAVTSLSEGVADHVRLSRPSWIARRALYRLILIGLGAGKGALGWTSPRLKLAFEHLMTLLRARRYEEFHDTLRRWRRRIFTLGRTPVEPPPPGSILIDARTDLLDLRGSIHRKLHTMTYPRETAPRLATIVIPCYNYGRFLPEAVESALAQTLGDVEVIIVDNGSEDRHTIEVVDGYRGRPRVSVIRLTPNRGLPAARNAGIEAAKGEYVCCLDADDIFEPTYLEKAVATLESDRSIGFAHCWVQVFGNESFVWQTRDFDPEQALSDNHTAVSGVFRRDDWLAAGRYNPSMHGGYDDWEYWLRLAMLGRRGKVIPEPLLRHRKHGSNMTGDAHSRRVGWMRRIEELNPAFFHDHAARARLNALAAAPPEGPRFAALSRARSDSGEPGQAARLPHMLVIVPWLPAGGGAEVLLLEILTKLRQSWRITILTTEPAVHDMQPQFEAVTSDIFHLSSILAEPMWADFISALASSRETRVVLSSGSGYLYRSIASLRRKCRRARFVDILHNDLPTGHLSGALAATRRLDRHVVVSRRIAQTMREAGVPARRIEVIENGVDVRTTFNPDRLDRARARAALGISAHAPVAAFVGRFSDEKRPIAYLDIMAALAGSPWQGIMVGDGQLAGEVKARLEGGLDRTIKHIPKLSRSELAEVYASSDVLIVTSSLEGMPFVVLEAMAMGAAVLATDVGNISEIVRNGENGHLVPADTPQAMVPLLLDLAGRPAAIAAMRNAARGSILDGGYTRGHMLKRYTDVIGAVTGINPGARQGAVRPDQKPAVLNDRARA